MNEKIDAFSKGIFRTDRAIVTFEPEVLYIKAKEGRVYEGEICFETSITSDIEVSLCCEEPFVNLQSAEYHRGKGRIRFSYDATYCQEGLYRKTHIHFLSSIGEYDIPVEISVGKPDFETSIGNVTDLFQFAGLAKANHSEALELFLSEEFINVFLKGKKEDILVYNGLLKSRSKDHALEEFLLFERKKMPVVLSSDRNDLEYHLARKPIKDFLQIKRSSWGYTHAKVSSSAEFVTSEKEYIDSDDFVSGRYELPIILNPENMHDGRNTAVITIGEGDEQLRINVSADYSGARPVRSSLEFKKKAYAVKLINNYINYRIGVMTTDQFTTSNRAVLYGIQIIDEGLIIELAGIHLNIIGKRITEARTSLERFGSKLKNADEFVLAYYAYLRMKLYPEEERFKKEAQVRLTKNVAEHPSEWWYVEMFLMSGHDKIKRPEDKIRFLREVYSAGCRSQILYYEVYTLFVANPELFSKLSDFEIQTFNWAEKRGFHDTTLEAQYVYHAENEKEFNPLVLKYLKKCYTMNRAEDTLAAICSILLKKTEKLNEDFIWFDKGVRAGIKLTGLYEGYMATVPTDGSIQISGEIYTYFQYDNSLSEAQKAFLYASVIAKKRDKSGIYESYLPQMRDFAKEMMQKGRISIHLGQIYDELLEYTDFEEEVAELLPNVIYKREISCNAPGIVGVAAASYELADEITADFIDGKAFIDTVDDETVFFMVDEHGNRFVLSVHYDDYKPLRTGRLADVAYAAGNRCSYVLIGRTNKAALYHNNNVEVAEEYGTLAEMQGLSDNYRNEVICTLINYYYDHFEGNLLEEYLLKVDLRFVPHDDRMRIIELFMIRDMVSTSIEAVKKYGFVGVSVKYLIRIFDHVIKNEDNIDTDFLNTLGWHIFLSGKADEVVFDFLGKYFVGSTNQHIELWEAMHDFGVLTGNLEERAITQMLNGERIPPGAARLFKAFYNRSIAERNVTARKLIRAFLAYEAYRYLASDDVLDDILFNDMREEIFYDGNDICKMAVLKYYSRKRELSGDELTFAEEYMRNSASKGNIMPFFASFAGRCMVPSESLNKSFVEVVANPDDSVYIHYRIIGDEDMENFVSEPMTTNYHGIFLKSFTLFFGEAVQYYVTISKQDERYILESQILELKEDVADESVTSEGLDESSYTLINLILLANDVNDDMTVKDVMNRYVGREHVIDKLFKPL